MYKIVVYTDRHGKAPLREYLLKLKGNLARMRESGWKKCRITLDCWKNAA